MKKNNKKAISYEFLLRLIVAVIFVGAAVIVFMQLFGKDNAITNEAKNSYAKFQKMIEEIGNPANVGSSKSVPLVMDDRTAIYAFSKESDAIKRVWSIEDLNAICKDGPPCLAFIKRPESCEKGKSCLCFCQDFDTLQVSASKREMKCSVKPACKSYENLDFWDLTPAIGLTEIKGDGKITISNLLSGGFIAHRKLSPGGLLTHLKELPRTQQIELQNYKNKVVVCRDKGCLTEDIKKIYEENRKKQQDLKAKAEFGSLIQFLQSCTGTCGKRTFTEGYNAYYVSSGFASKDRWPFEHGIYLTIDKSEPEEKDAIISGKINYIKLLLYSKDKELDTGYLFKNNEADFFFSRDKIIVG